MFYQKIIEVFIDKSTKNRQFIYLYMQLRYKSYSLPHILSVIFINNFLQTTCFLIFWKIIRLKVTSFS